MNDSLRQEVEELKKLLEAKERNDLLLLRDLLKKQLETSPIRRLQEEASTIKDVSPVVCINLATEVISPPSDSSINKVTAKKLRQPTILMGFKTQLCVQPKNGGPARVILPRGRVAVSYTHLTLPTICSV